MKKNICLILVIISFSFAISGCVFLDNMNVKEKGEFKSVEFGFQSLTFEKIAKANSDVVLIRSDLNLIKQLDGLNINWTVSGVATDASINVETGKVLRGEKDASVLLTAEVFNPNNGEKKYKKFDLKILNKNYERDTKMVELPTGTFICSRSSGAAIDMNYVIYCSKTETTYEEYDRYCIDKKIPLVEAAWGRNKMPVGNVSWWDAIKYCNYLSEIAGYPKAYNEVTGELLDANGDVTNSAIFVKGYRLPNEAEWEYAASAWKSKPNNIQDDYSRSIYGIINDVDLGEYAWTYKNIVSKANEVGKKLPNEKGLHDMSGNVWEWCNDTVTYSLNTDTAKIFTGDGTKIIKGGSYANDNGMNSYKVLEKGQTQPVNRSSKLGFRVVITK